MLAAPAIVAIAIAAGWTIVQAIGLWVGAIPLLALPMAVEVFKLGYRHWLAHGEGGLDRDVRPRVLFLREFGHERAIVEESSSLLRGTFENSLVNVFRFLSPVVAIGRPEENLPPSGAIRIYVDDDHWQERVLRLIGESCLIVIQAKGKSNGLLWEVDQVFKHQPFKPILIAFPFGYGGIWSERESYLNFKESFEPVTGIPLPDETHQFLYFDRPGPPQGLASAAQALALIDSYAFDRFVKARRLLSISRWCMALCLVSIALYLCFFGTDMVQVTAIVIVFFAVFATIVAAILKGGIRSRIAIATSLVLFVSSIAILRSSYSDRFGDIAIPTIIFTLVVFFMLLVLIFTSTPDEREDHGGRAAVLRLKCKRFL